jgi:hypothetical protein
MLSFIPLALVVSLILNAPALWDAFNNPQADLFGILTRLVLVTVLAVLVLSVANRVLAHYLAHPKIDIVASSAVQPTSASSASGSSVDVAGELGAGGTDGEASASATS